MLQQPNGVVSETELRSMKACPSCGSADLTKVEPSLMQRALMWGGAARGAFRRSRSCKSCNATIEVAK
jgi:hypothetical protein